MNTTPTSALVDLIEPNEETLLNGWMREQKRAGRSSLLPGEDIEGDSREFLRLLTATMRTASTDNLGAAGWDQLREHLARLSRTRAEAGFSPSETAMFVFSLKQPLFTLLGDEFAGDAPALTQAIWEATVLIDGLGLLTTEAYQTAREAVIDRQQRELMELSTPVVKLWDGV